MKKWSVNERNISSYFIAPMLRAKYSWLERAGVVNVFIGDESFPELNNHIFLLVKFNGSRNFIEYEKQLSDKNIFPTYHSRYDPDTYHTMYVYEVPSKYQTDYDLLTKYEQTFYSKLSTEYKDLILKCHDADITSHVYKTMNKDEELFLAWEEVMNKGLPRHMHTKIPRDQEAQKSLDLDVEIYRKWMNVKKRNLLIR